ncbi:hypothetical protein B0H17DRAFT_1128405 [Mycena rosella]|uniref:Uncharacterized protein n=1 Tax=Mycena rosella TaxID=1033263 RepID=A0AAD7GQW2_MYCRO|nr:hypothetical protein B0H17DRAFT_1128405 [Mycena rosella]
MYLQHHHLPIQPQPLLPPPCFIIMMYTHPHARPPHPAPLLRTHLCTLPKLLSNKFSSVSGHIIYPAPHLDGHGHHCLLLPEQGVHGDGMHTHPRVCYSCRDVSKAAFSPQLMIHMLDGSSGVGDPRNTGIDTFLMKHEA